MHHGCYQDGGSFESSAGDFSANIRDGMDVFLKIYCLPKDHWTLKTGYFEDPTPASYRFVHPSIGRSKILRACFFFVSFCFVLFCLFVCLFVGLKVCCFLKPMFFFRAKHFFMPSHNVNVEFSSKKNPRRFGSSR